MNAKYQKLFEPINLPNGEVISNRVVIAPMTTESANPDGTVADAELRYYAARANGVGMFITACIAVSPNGITFPGQFVGFDERQMPRLRLLAETIKRGGGKAILQMQHGGRQCPLALVDGDVVSSGAVGNPRNVDAAGNMVVPRELSEAEIRGIIKDFGQVTRMAIDAGFDGVEIHGANTYLIQQFFSPLTNTRSDLWGGSVDKRMTFPLQVVNEVQTVVRQAKRPDFIVGYRFSPEEFETPGIRFDETLQLVDRLAGYGLDYLHVSLAQADLQPRMEAKSQAAIVTQLRDIIDGRLPLIAVGSIFTPEQAVAALELGADFAALGRVAVIDPDWLAKVEAGREAEIVQTFDAEGADATAVPELMRDWILAKPGWFPGTE